MRYQRVILYVFFLISIARTASSEKDIKDLPEKYRKWLEEDVVYIISPREKEVFLALDNDRDRDLFIQAFWKQRDPVPLTDINEFKEEHYRRIEYANKNFGRLSTAPGWKTDRGRVYITLGPPVSIQRFEESSFAYPVLVWNYQGMSVFGLPDSFNIVFFRKYGLGDYRIYHPVMDGPQSLLTAVGIDQTDPSQAYQVLYAQAPELAQLSINLIPGEPLSEDMPSLRSEQLLSDINLAPFKSVKEEYALKFFQYKGTVDVDYSVNYVGNDSVVQVIRDESEIFFIHYLIEMDRFSVQVQDNKLITKLIVNGKVSDGDGRTIFQYERAIPIELDQAQAKEIRGQKYSLADIFPIIEGNYVLNILVKNEASKEFTSIERSINIPEPNSLQMSALLLAYKVEGDLSDKAKAFKIGSYQLFPTASHVFGKADNLIIFFQIFNLTNELRERGTLRINIEDDDKVLKILRKKIDENHGKNFFLEEFSLSDVPPGYYKIKASLLGEYDREIASEESHFSVSQFSTLPRPWVSYSVHASLNSPVYYSMLADQLFKKGEKDRAKLIAEKAYQLNPESISLAMNFGRILFSLKEYKSVINVLTPFLLRNHYETLELLARSCHALGDLNRAISYYNEYLSHYGANFYILNFLGECYYRVENMQGALRAWQKSLEVNPDQEEIKKMVDMLKKRK